MTMARALLLVLLLASAACGKKGADRFEPEEDEEGTGFEPDATEVPMTADFAQAASRRVKADNYREELLRIERELKFASRTREP